MRRLRVSPLLAVAMGVFLTAVAAIAYMILGPTELDREIARIRAKGEPTTWEDLATNDVDPARLTAYRQIEAIGQSITDDANQLNGGGYSGFWPFGLAPDPPKPSEPWPDEPIAEQFLKEQAPRLAQLSAIAGKNPCIPFDPDVDPHGGFGISVIATKGATRLLQLEAYLAMRRGESKRAIRAITTTLQIVQAVETSPFDIAHTVAFVFHHIAVEDTKRVLECREVDNGEVANLQARFAARDTRGSLRTIFLDRRLETIEAAHIGSLKERLEDSWHVIQHNRWKLFPVRTQEVVLLGEATAHCGDAWPDLIEHIERLSDENKANWLAAGQAKSDHRSLGSMVAWAAISQTKSRLVEGAIAVRRYQLKRGKSPATLAELVPEFLAAIPVDPFDGQPIRFRPKEGSLNYTVYSVGFNKVDDGGKRQGPSYGPDIPLTIEPVAGK